MKQKVASIEGTYHQGIIAGLEMALKIAQGVDEAGDYSGMDENGGSFWESDAGKTKEEIVTTIKNAFIREGGECNSDAPAATS